MIRVKEKHVRFGGIPVLAFIMMIVMKDHDAHLSVWQRYLVSLIFTFVYWNGAVFIINYLRKKMPGIQQTFKRLVVSMVCVLVFIIVASVPLRILMGYADLSILLSMTELLDHKTSSLLAAIFLSTAYECAFFFTKWKETVIQNEVLKNQQMRTQFEVLKNQMSPHFLFNSLNTLTTLISENQETAIDFTQKLSEVYRYILQNKERELVTLEEEIAFCHAYMFLLQIRYPENLTVDIHLDDRLLSSHIPPLTLQMLLENCVKHNIISRSQPLRIQVYSERENSVIVKNNLQPRRTPEKSTRTGLANIQQRYRLLSEGTVQTVVTQENYMVIVPLITISREEKLAGVI